MMIGARLRDRFVIERALGGGAGRLRWAARDDRGGAEVEVWTATAVRDAAPWIAAMAKARAVPGLRRVVEHGHDHGAAWIAYAAARPGPQVDATRPMPLEHVVGWARAVMAGLAAAHRAGWVHGGLIVDDVAVAGADVRLGGVGLWSGLAPAALIAAWGDDAWQLAPEVRGGAAATEASDAWAMAFAAARLGFGDHRDRAALIARARDRGAAMAELIDAALAEDAAQRPTIAAFVDGLVTIARAEPDSPVADDETEIGPAPTAPPAAKLVAVSLRAPDPERPPAPPPPMRVAPPPIVPRVQLRSISEALPPAFSTREGALGYLAPPASRREPRPIEPARRLLVIVATAAIVVLIAVIAIVALAR